MNRRSPLLVIFFTIFLDLLGFGIVIPLLPFFAKDLGASGLEVGLLMTAYSGMQFIFSPLWGRISDRIGRRPVLLLSITANVAAMLLFAASSTLTFFFLARAFAGMANANIGTAQAYVADITGPEDRAKGMGLVGAAIGMGFVLGPAIGGLLARYGMAAPALAAAALSFVNLVLAYFLLPESLSPEAREAAQARRGSRLQTFVRSLDHPILPFLFVLFFLLTVAFSQMEATFALFTQARFGYGTTANGYLFAFIGVMLALVQGALVGPLRRSIGEAGMLLAGTVVLAMGLLALAGIGSVAGLLVACSLLAVGHGISNPSLSTLVSKQAPHHEQGKILGVNQSMASLARVVGPFIGGLAFDKGSEVAPFLSAAGVLGIGILIALRVFLRRHVAEAVPLQDADARGERGTARGPTGDGVRASGP